MNPEELDRMSHAALTWLHGHAADFRLPDDVTHPRIDRNVTLKPLGELAQLGVSTLRASAPGSAQHLLSREMLDFAWEETSRGELFLELVRGEPHATYPMEIYGSFAEAGLRHERFEEYARFTAGTRAWRLTEHDPTRRLALLNTLRRLEVLVPEETAADARGRTWLGGLAEPWAFEIHAGYALTHYVFHVANWGGAPDRLPPDVCHYLTLWLPAWLDSCIEHGHWDLTGELLAVTASLPDPAAVPVADAWRAYATAQDPVGGAIAETGPPPDEENEETFLACYHSTLVGAFAAVLAAARLRAAAPAAGAPVAASSTVPTTGGDLA